MFTIPDGAQIGKVQNSGSAPGRPLPASPESCLYLRGTLPGALPHLLLEDPSRRTLGLRLRLWVGSASSLLAFFSAALLLYSDQLTLAPLLGP